MLNDLKKQLVKLKYLKLEIAIRDIVFNRHDQKAKKKP